jgi:hypothetical protein
LAKTVAHKTDIRKFAEKLSVFKFKKMLSAIKAVTLFNGRTKALKCDKKVHWRFRCHRVIVILRVGGKLHFYKLASFESSRHTCCTWYLYEAKCFQIKKNLHTNRAFFIWV